MRALLIAMLLVVNTLSAATLTVKIVDVDNKPVPFVVVTSGDWTGVADSLGMISPPRPPPPPHPPLPPPKEGKTWGGAIYFLPPRLPHCH
jgi:hypothetical protein